MIYERFPQLHSLSAEEKVALAEELVAEAAKASARVARVVPGLLARDPSRLSRMEPDWKTKGRKDV